MQITFFGICIRRRYFKRVLSAVPLKLPRYFKRCAARATQHAQQSSDCAAQAFVHGWDSASSVAGIAEQFWCCNAPSQLCISLRRLRKRLCAAVVGSLISRSRGRVQMAAGLQPEFQHLSVFGKFCWILWARCCPFADALPRLLLRICAGILMGSFWSCDAEAGSGGGSPSWGCSFLWHRLAASFRCRAAWFASATSASILRAASLLATGCASASCGLCAVSGFFAHGPTQAPLHHQGKAAPEPLASTKSSKWSPPVMAQWD